MDLEDYVFRIGKYADLLVEIERALKKIPGTIADLRHIDYMYNQLFLHAKDGKNAEYREKSIRSKQQIEKCYELLSLLNKDYQTFSGEVRRRRS